MPTPCSQVYLSQVILPTRPLGELASAFVGGVGNFSRGITMRLAREMDLVDLSRRIHQLQQELIWRAVEYPKVAQERLGHSTITATMNIYSHFTPTVSGTLSTFLAPLTKITPNLGK